MKREKFFFLCTTVTIASYLVGVAAALLINMFRMR